MKPSRALARFVWTDRPNEGEKSLPNTMKNAARDGGKFVLRLVIWTALVPVGLAFAFYGVASLYNLVAG